MDHHIDMSWQRYEDANTGQFVFLFHVFLLNNSLTRLETRERSIGATIALRFKNESSRPMTLYARSGSNLEFCSELSFGVNRRWLTERENAWRYGLPSNFFMFYDDDALHYEYSDKVPETVTVERHQFKEAKDRCFGHITRPFNSTSELLGSEETNFLVRDTGLDRKALAHGLFSAIANMCAGHVNETPLITFPYSERSAASSSPRVSYEFDPYSKVDSDSLESAISRHFE